LIPSDEMGLEFRTLVEPPLSGDKISHQTPVLFMGSCFASEIGRKAESGKIPVLINPHGTLFNPLSVSRALLRFAEGYSYSKRDLYLFENRYYSLDHYTLFSSEDPDELVERLNTVNNSAHDFLLKASFLFITFGTAWVFDLKENGDSVANCHKLPASLFLRRQAEVSEIENIWADTLERVLRVNPSLKVWFTVSPVRHLNDGLHANQLSKSRLLLACDRLMSYPSVTGYFPSYELFMDDLRDYRFYATDMLHPSDVGLMYVWNRFTESFFTMNTMSLWSEADRISKAMAHRILGDRNTAGTFARAMLKKIDDLSDKASYIDLSAEREYFESIKE